MISSVDVQSRTLAIYCHAMCTNNVLENSDIVLNWLMVSLVSRDGQTV